MDYEGRIAKVLPVRSGTSSKGAWKTLPFVFEFFETGDQRWPDRVLIETMDHDIMRTIGQFVVRGADNKGIEENGAMKLRGEIKCRCGFSHSVREWDGKIFNQIRLYKLQLLEPATDAAGVVSADVAKVNGTVGTEPQRQEESDDLPF